jgi:hypothetical protein
MTDFFERAIHTVRELAPRWLGSHAAATLPQDLTVLDSGIAFCQGRDELDYFWYRLALAEGDYQQIGYRVVRLAQLRFIPMEARADAGLMQKMRTVLRGLYGSQVDLIYLVAGIFDPPVGILQCYGVASFDTNLETAIETSRHNLAALKAGLAGALRQIRLAPLDTRLCQWIFSAFSEMKHTVVTVGHPDPRELARTAPSAAFRNPLTDGNSNAHQFSLQQNEILFRGMADLKEEFLFLVLTSPIGIEAITQPLAGLAEHTASWASWQSGARSASFGISLPAILSGALAHNASLGYSDSDGSSHSDGTAPLNRPGQHGRQRRVDRHASSRGWSHMVRRLRQCHGWRLAHHRKASPRHSPYESQSVTDGTSHTDGSSSSSSHVDSFNWGLNAASKVGIVIADGLDRRKHRLGVGGQLLQFEMSSDTTSHAETKGAADTTSHAETNSQADTLSHANTHTTSEAWGTSGSETDSWGKTTSQSQTDSASDTTSQADSTMQSVSASQALGRGFRMPGPWHLTFLFNVQSLISGRTDPAMLVTHCCAYRSSC